MGAEWRCRIRQKSRRLGCVTPHCKFTQPSLEKTFFRVGAALGSEHQGRSEKARSTRNRLHTRGARTCRSTWTGRTAQREIVMTGLLNFQESESGLLSGPQSGVGVSGVDSFEGINSFKVLTPFRGRSGSGNATKY